MTESPSMQSVPAEQSPQDMPSFYSNWRRRVHGWIANKTRRELADAVLLLPDMLALVIRLIRDPRTPLFFKSQLVIVAAYVVIPIDIIPEAVIGAAGLADDVVILSVMVMRLIQSATEIDDQVIRDLWPGSGDPTDILKDVASNDGDLMNTQLFNSLRTLLGMSLPPDPAVVRDPQATTTTAQQGER